MSRSSWMRARRFAVAGGLVVAGSLFAMSLSAQSTLTAAALTAADAGRKCDCNAQEKCGNLGWCCEGPPGHQTCGCTMFVPNCDLNDT